MATREPLAGDERAVKRRRTSSGSATSSSATLDSGSPRVDSREDAHVGDKGKGKSRAERLAGFDDEQEPEAPLADTRDRQPHAHDDALAEDDSEEDPCAICLAPIDNKTVVYPCHHGQFCWNCIRAWTDQSRKCPLCLGPIEHLIHNIRSEKDYSTYHLLPLHTLANPSSSSLPPLRSRRPPPASASTPSLPRHALYGKTAQQSLDCPTPRERLEEIALERRKYVYREGLYAKHVASNRYTGFKPFSPQIFTQNTELKARVIKFIRRELQVFPAVDVSFLTTYLISIASQLDLRSPAALRLVSDFLSDADAEHLVHEIVTFARSPFVSLEGYDRFIQYGRPEKRVENETERLMFDETMDGSGQKADQPRFAPHMARRKEEDEEQEHKRRRYSNEQRTRPRSISPPPWSPPRDRRDSFRDQGGRGGGRESGYRRSRGGFEREKEPDWRDRDERYTGSYYRHSDSRKDRRSGYTVFQAAGNDDSVGLDRRTEMRGQDIHRGGGTAMQQEPLRLVQPPVTINDAPRPVPALDLILDREHALGLPSMQQPSCRLLVAPVRQLRPASMREPNALRLHRGNLSFEIRIPESRGDGSGFGSGEATKLEPDGGREKDVPFKPTLSIFGAARRLLGNGNIVTFSNEGKIELQVAGPSTSKMAGDMEQGKGTSHELGPETLEKKEKEKRILEDRYRPVAAAPSLLSRLGPAHAAGAPSTDPTPPLEPRSADASSAPSTPSTALTTAARLKAKLQERLTAEYRQALLQLSSATPNSTNARALADAQRKITNVGSGGGDKVDLRALLQSRLQAEKALAYDSQQRNSAAAAASGLTSTSSHSSTSATYHGAPSKTTFSQATKDLLLLRLEEERMLAQGQNDPWLSVISPAHQARLDDASSLFPAPPANPLAIVKPLPLSVPVTPSSQPKSGSMTTAMSSESSLKAKLLEKRKLAVEEELERRSGQLKEKLMREKLMKQRKAKQPT
ncbi:hypothetical protein JCM11491_003580 [Sporobolomyces phaffii]